MPRCAAWRAIVSWSPGRRRMVMRSVAGAGVSTHLAGGPFESSSERMPIRARVDSDIPRLEASSAKRRFSSAVGRAVIEGGGPALTP